MIGPSNGVFLKTHTFHKETVIFARIYFLRFVIENYVNFFNTFANNLTYLVHTYIQVSIGRRKEKKQNCAFQKKMKKRNKLTNKSMYGMQSTIVVGNN